MKVYNIIYIYNIYALSDQYSVFSTYSNYGERLLTSCELAKVWFHAFAHLTRQHWTKVNRNPDYTARRRFASLTMVLSYTTWFGVFNCRNSWQEQQFDIEGTGLGLDLDSPWSITPKHMFVKIVKIWNFQIRSCPLIGGTTSRISLPVGGQIWPWWMVYSQNQEPTEDQKTEHGLVLIISFYICIFTFVFFISFYISNLKLRVERCYA